MEPILASLSIKGGAVERGKADGLYRREAGFDQKFDVALLAEAGDEAAIAGWVAAGHQQAAGRGEPRPEEHLFLELGVAGAELGEPGAGAQQPPWRFG